MRELRGRISGLDVPLADFSHLPTRCQFLAFMPQWDFLDLLAARASRYPGFRLHMQSEATHLDLAADGITVTGVQAMTPSGPLRVGARLTVAADGRDSVLADQAGLRRRAFSAPIDVLWLRLPRRPEDASGPFGLAERGHVLVFLDLGDYWQCGYVIAKGDLGTLHEQGISALRRRLFDAAPFLGVRVNVIRTWDDVKALTVQVDRLARWWRPGLLVIGDAAHAMSPVGGVGINLAIQDAVAAANLLVEPLRSGSVADRHLRRVARRRFVPTVLTQALQICLHELLLRPALERHRQRSPHRVLRAFVRLPQLRRIPARLIGLGFLPEHVHSPVSTPSTPRGPRA